MRTDHVDRTPGPAARCNRNAFLNSIRNAIKEERGFAAGKLGYSEQVWIASRNRDRLNDDPRLERATRASVRFHACTQIGVFPDSEEYISLCGESFAQALGEVDFLAVHASPLVGQVISQLPRTPTLVEFNELEPNRNTPYEADDCYLPALRDRRVLIVTSPARLLAQRANRETFAAVWRNIDCPWFSPHSVEALSFPSLFDPAVHKEFTSSLEVLGLICREISHRDFDVALVAAGSLGIPIAQHVKRLGKVGLSLGGHLQVLFGVQGRRWREDAQWQRAYVNEAWIDMPSEDHRRGRGWLADDGAYW